MKQKKAKFQIVDRFRSGKPKEDRDDHLGMTDDPVEALRAVKKAVHFGVIQMFEPDGRRRDFTAQTHYTSVHRALPSHRSEPGGDGRWHGFIEYCESYGYGSPIPARKPRKKRKKATAA